MQNVIEPKPNLKALFRYPILQEGRYGKLRLDKNENTTGFSQEIIRDILSEVSADFLAAYPEPYSLYRKIADQNHIDIDSVLLTAGSEMAIRYLFEAYLAANDEIIILNPSFAMFEVYANIIGANVQLIDYDENFLVPASAIINRITNNTKIIAIANPNNPTGTVLSVADLVKILDAAKDRSIVLIDEAYYHFCKETMLPRIAEFSNLVVTRTFSKACGIAGVRLGYAVGSPQIISQVKKLQPIDHISNFAVHIGNYLLDHQDLVWNYVAEVEEGKKYLLAQMEQQGLRYRDSRGNFILVDLGNCREEIVRQLKDRNILIGSNLRFPFPSGYARVTAGSMHQMRHFADALRDILSIYAHAPSNLYGTVQ